MLQGALSCRTLLMLPLQVLRPAPRLWLVIDKPKQRLPGGRSAMPQQAAEQTLSTLYVQQLLLSGLERPFKHCCRLCELRPAAIVKLLPFSGYL